MLVLVLVLVRVEVLVVVALAVVLAEVLGVRVALGGMQTRGVLKRV